MLNKKQISTRESYGLTLLEIGEKDENIVVLDADLSKSTKTSIFAEKFPNRFFNCGIAEANMACIAAGLALCDKIPFISTFAIFGAGRAYEQIRNSISYPNLNVKICVSHSGITVGEDGATHQAFEDISLMRNLPEMKIISPCDHFETKEAVKFIAKEKGTFYLRLSRPESPILNNENYKFNFGKAITLKEGKDLTIITTGFMVSRVLNAQNYLKSLNINCKVLNMHTIKPIDKNAIIKAAKETGAILTVEEHSIIGGLGTAVSEVIAENRINIAFLRHGLYDVFGMSGKYQDLLDFYNLNEKGIIEKSVEVFKMKNENK